MTSFTGHLTIALLSGLLFFSCTSGEKEEEVLVEATDTIKTTIVNVGGELFSIPSPIQTALLVHRSGVVYDKSILSPSKIVNTYLTDYSKALILGVYGADLAYVSLYNQTQDAIGYLAAVKQLSDKLGLNAAFDNTTLERIKTNIANKDSMTVLVGLAYRGSDAYLKTNKRNDISSLILAGGWVESLYFSISAYKSKPNDELRYRIAEQKQALNSIRKILTDLAQPELKDLTEDLNDLSKEYEQIQFKYTFVEPVHDTVKKLTYINSTSEVLVSEGQLEKITSKLMKIREKIVNTAQS
jgi:hypothetical protein